MKIGVIIQGPVVTFGDGPNNVHTGFDASQTILSNIHNLRKLNIDYVVSTWLPNNSREKHFLTVLLDAGIHITHNQAPKVFDPYNAYKQHYSMMLGAKWLLKNKPYHYLIKIRTDMLIPQEFWSWLIKVNDIEKQKLLVSELYRGHPYYLGDFVIGGSTKTFCDYIRAVLVHKTTIFFPLSAFDDGLKYLGFLGYLPVPRKNKKLLDMYYWYVTKKDLIQRIWNQFITTQVDVMPLQFWQDIQWRGKKMTEVIDPTLFLFKPLPDRPYAGSFFEQSVFLTQGFIRLFKKHQKDKGTFLSLLFARSIDIFEWFVFKMGASFSKWKSIIVGARPMILGRFSCIGRDTLALAIPDNEFNTVNQQKVRVDLLLEWLSGAQRPRASEVEPYMMRKDVFPLITNQEQLPWFNSRDECAYLLMDSFSELTDKKFVHKEEKWAFCCHYSDLQSTDQFKKEFEYVGELKESEFFSAYLKFFEWFEQVYPKKNVYFLLVPTTLDMRPHYKRRAQKINVVIQKIARLKPFLHPISLEEDKVRHAVEDSFPYHFHKSTYYAFLEKWNIIRDVEAATK